MAELLVRVVDKVNNDSVYLDAKCLKRGDVVVVCPDGWVWSDLERKNPDWHIVKVPGMSMSEAQAFTSPEIGDPKLNLMLRPRAFKVDVDTLAKAEKSLETTADKGIKGKQDILANARAVESVTLTAKKLTDAKVLKVGLTDPAVIGDNKAVIG